jgi:hypothetical protein
LQYGARPARRTTGDGSLPCKEIHDNGEAADATYQAVADRFGERGDLLA